MSNPMNHLSIRFLGELMLSLILSFWLLIKQDLKVLHGLICDGTVIEKISVSVPTSNSFAISICQFK
jgi:hypothetical protein